MVYADRVLDLASPSWRFPGMRNSIRSASEFPSSAPINACIALSNIILTGDSRLLFKERNLPPQILSLADTGREAEDNVRF